MKHIRFYTLPNSTFRCSRFFKAEIIPTQIEDKVHQIAQGVANSINPPMTIKANTTINTIIDEPKQTSSKETLVQDDNENTATEMQSTSLRVVR